MLLLLLHNVLFSFFFLFSSRLLARFFFRTSDAKSAPKSLRNRSKIVPKWTHKPIRKAIAKMTRKKLPKSSEKAPQNGSKIDAKTASIHQKLMIFRVLGPRLHPRPPQEPQDPSQDRFSIDFCFILDRFRVAFSHCLLSYFFLLFLFY